jgi:hypothetical protein
MRPFVSISMARFYKVIIIIIIIIINNHRITKPKSQ